MKNDRSTKNDVSIAFVQFSDKSGGKSRPVLVLTVSNAVISALALTSQYDKKSSVIKKQYYELKDWNDAGLNKPTWVDIKNRVLLPNGRVNFNIIGRISNRDIKGLDEFIENYYRQIK
ncbi:hypothetical protein [Holzapfeliella sp. JNUCC 80]